MKILSTYREAFLEDEELLTHVMVGESWRPHHVLNMAALGEFLTEDECVIFKKFTGRDYKPGQRVKQFHTIGGRRTGKTVKTGGLSTYLATCIDYSDVLVKGETGVLLCLAQTQSVATQILNYVEENLKASKILKQKFVRRTADGIELTNNIRIEVRPASFRKLRGPTYIAVACDELAFFYTEDFYTNTDVEVLRAARPGLLTTHGPIITISSPYAKRGVLWEAYKRHYGPAGSPLILVAKGTTRDFNPTISEAEIALELERDPEANRAELLAEFRSDIDSFIGIEVVESCVGDFYEIPPSHRWGYFLFIDSSGNREDSFCIAIAHKDGDKIIVDLVREWRPPFSIDGVIDEICALAKSYRIGKATGDRYAGDVIADMFRKRSLPYDPTDYNKSDLYHDLLPLLNTRAIVLPRNERLIMQIVGLERRVGSTGRNSINHAPGGHDDIVNAVAGVAKLVHQKRVLFGPGAPDWIGCR
jgi:hypothetical protein